jgi:hypothetical protein
LAAPALSVTGLSLPAETLIQVVRRTPPPAPAPVTVPSAPPAKVDSGENIKPSKPKSKSSAPPEAPARETAEAVETFTPAYLMAPPPQTPATDDSLSTLWTFLYPAMLKLICAGERPCQFCEFNADFYNLDFVSQTPERVSFRVQVDETQGHYAEWSGIPQARIKSFNGISNNLRLGQTISLPLDSAQAEEFLNRRIEHHMSIEEDFFNNYTVTGMDTAAVKWGANVWTICQDNDIPLWLFMKANQLPPDLKISDRDRVLVPQVEEKK